VAGADRRGRFLARAGSAGGVGAFNQIDARALPADQPAVMATRVLADRFPGQEATPVDVVLPTPPATRLVSPPTPPRCREFPASCASALR